MQQQSKRKANDGQSTNNAVKRAKTNAIIPLMPWTVFNHCLSLIFDQLTLTELANVADAHPDFVPAARSVYHRKFRNWELVISKSGHTLKANREGVLVTFESFMKHFGTLMQRLNLDYNSSKHDAHHWRETERLILENCTESLAALQLTNCRRKAFEEIYKPFEKVKRLCIKGNEPNILEETLGRSKWFPNANYIEPYNTRSRNRNRESAAAPAMDGSKDEGEDEPHANASVKMTDLNEYCLEAIFQHLSVRDLTNIANTCKYFGPAAKLIYRRKYSERMLTVLNSGHDIKFKGKGVLKVTLATFLKHFGKFVFKLALIYNLNGISHHWRQAERLIFDHCSDTLKCFEVNCLDYNRKQILEEIRKPFVNVEEFHYFGSIARRDLLWNGIEVNKVFPKLRRLVGTGDLLGYLAFANEPYHSLKELEIHYMVAQEPIQDLLRINCHIERLTFYATTYYDLLVFLSETMTRLEHLNIRFENRGTTLLTPIHFKSVTSFAIHQFNWSTISFSNSYPFTFDNLMSLEIKIEDVDLQDGDTWCNFVKKNRGLVDLKVTINDDSTDDKYSAEELFQVVSALPNLQTFHFTTISLNFDERELFLQKCKRLKQLTNVAVTHI